MLGMLVSNRNARGENNRKLKQNKCNFLLHFSPLDVMLPALNGMLGVSDKGIFFSLIADTQHHTMK